MSEFIEIFSHIKAKLCQEERKAFTRESIVQLLYYLIECSDQNSLVPRNARPT